MRRVLLLCGLLADACGNVRYPIGGDAAARDQVPATSEAAPPLKGAVDLLFMIDNSNSMEPKQKALIAAFPRLIEGLKVGGALPDLKIGVVSSDLGTPGYAVPTCTASGDGGKLQHSAHTAGCPVPGDPWISYRAGVTNIAAGPADPVERVKAAFTCIGSLGTSGCGFEQPLESVRRALDPKQNVNPGFLRTNALLVVFFVTEEDDCSASDPSLFDPAAEALLGPLQSYRCTRFGLACDEALTTAGVKTGCKPGGVHLHPPSSYISFFQGLKPAGKVILAGLAGPTAFVKVSGTGSSLALDPSCQGESGAAVPALRLEAVITGVGNGSFFNAGIDASEAPVSLSACNLDFEPALRFLAKKIAATF